MPHADLKIASMVIAFDLQTSFLELILIWELGKPYFSSFIVIVVIIVNLGQSAAWK